MQDPKQSTVFIGSKGGEWGLLAPREGGTN